MIEIVFSDSACGSLREAQSFGKCEYFSGDFGVILTKHDDTTPNANEIEKAEKQFLEEKKEWSKATPMGGNAEDVFGFNLMLSIGDISNDDFIKNRANLIKKLWSIYSDFPEDEATNLLKNMQKDIENIFKCLTSDSEIRIWYSNHPDEVCGLYWFMAELEKFSRQPKSVYIVKLPEYQQKDDNTIINHLSWGDISPADWYNYTALAEKTTALFRKHCRNIWKTLQRENRQLRAVINGKIHSVSDDIYDSFIHREIENSEDEFSEAMLIGNILGKYQLGISDAWLAYRIEKFIENKTLEIASKHNDGMPLYHRYLRKVKNSNNNRGEIYASH